MKKMILFLLSTLIFANLSSAQVVTSVVPGEGTLSQAIANAVDGEVLELVPEGEYTESSAYVFGTIVDKSITIDVEGDVMKRDCIVRYKRGGRVLAVASIYRDKESLEAGAAMERDAAKT